MKHLFAALCWAILIGGFFAACTKKPPVPMTTPPAPHGEEYQEDEPDPDETVLKFDPDETAKWFPVKDKDPQGPIYFDFNSFAIKDRDKCTALAFRMKQTGRKVDLAGHTSQEGTDDYNLALGARRAQAVRDYLVAFGVRESQISWKSFGEESPVTEDPAQYSLNRRVEFFLEDPQ